MLKTFVSLNLDSYFFSIYFFAQKALDLGPEYFVYKGREHLARFRGLFSGFARGGGGRVLPLSLSWSVKLCMPPAIYLT